MKFSSTIIFILLLAGSVVLFYFVFHRPYAQEIEALQEGIFSGQRRIVVEQNITQVMQEKTFRVKEMREDVAHLRESLLPPGQSSPLMNHLRSLFNQFVFRDEKISLAGRERREQFDVSVYELRLEGGFKEIYSFVLGLEDLTFAVQIDKLNIHGISNEKDMIAVEMAISVPMDSL